MKSPELRLAETIFGKDSPEAQSVRDREEKEFIANMREDAAESDSYAIEFFEN